MGARDKELLEDFVHRGCDAAFSQIVQRYVDLIHGAAVRQVGDIHLADDVTQATFIILARRASSVSAAYLPGWLLATARLCAKDALRQQARRSRHERQAATLRPIVSSPTENNLELSAELDAALSRLRAKESTAIAMRYLQDRPLSDVAAAMGISIDAAQKIVARSLQKLRRMFADKGIILSSTAILSERLTQLPLPSAPAGLARSISNASADSLSIAKGALTAVRWMRIKTVAAITAAIIIAGGTGVAVFSYAVAQTVPAQPASSQPLSTGQAEDAAALSGPFIELVGCRIKQTIELKLPAAPQTDTSPTLVEQQYPVLRWTVDPAIAVKATGYIISVDSADDRSHIGTIDADSTTREKWLKDLLSNPGRYVVTLLATGSGDKLLGDASITVTVKPLTFTTIQIHDLQADDSDRIIDVTQLLNGRKNFSIRTERLEASNHFKYEKLADQWGNIPFQLNPKGNTFQITLNHPVAPGEAEMFLLSGTATGTITRTNDGLRNFPRNPVNTTNSPARRIELFVLPPGARAVTILPVNLPTRVVDGRVEIYLDQMMPGGGNIAEQIQYRMANSP